jgi:hypothetical protein
MPHLDRYEEEGLDRNEEFSELSFGERRAAEAEMRKRDREAGIGYGEDMYHLDVDDEDGENPLFNRVRDNWRKLEFSQQGDLVRLTTSRQSPPCSLSPFTTIDVLD